MPAINLSDETFARLQAHAVPFIDNPETVIKRLIDFYEDKKDHPESAAEAENYCNIRQFNPAAPPDLTHTKVLSIEFCGKQLDRSQANWNGLLNATIREAKAHGKSSADLKPLVIVPFVQGKKTVEGFRFLSDIGISIQGQDSNGAWKASYHIAQQLGRQLRVTFAWREKEGASFPGQTGQISTSAR